MNNIEHHEEHTLDTLLVALNNAREEMMQHKYGIYRYITAMISYMVIEGYIYSKGITNNKDIHLAFVSLSVVATVLFIHSILYNQYIITLLSIEIQRIEKCINHILDKKIHIWESIIVNGRWNMPILAIMAAFALLIIFQLLYIYLMLETINENTWWYYIDYSIIIVSLIITIISMIEIYKAGQEKYGCE